MKRRECTDEAVARIALADREGAAEPTEFLCRVPNAIAFEGAGVECRRSSRDAESKALSVRNYILGEELPVRSASHAKIFVVLKRRSDPLSNNVEPNPLGFLGRSYHAKHRVSGVTRTEMQIELVVVWPGILAAPVNGPRMGVGDRFAPIEEHTRHDIDGQA